MRNKTISKLRGIAAIPFCFIIIVICVYIYASSKFYIQYDSIYVSDAAFSFCSQSTSTLTSPVSNDVQWLSIHMELLGVFLVTPRGPGGDEQRCHPLTWE